MRKLVDMLRVSRALSVHSVLGMVPESRLAASLRVRQIGLVARCSTKAKHQRHELG